MTAALLLGADGASVGAGLYQFSAVHPPQFTICHLCTYSQIIKNEKVFEDYEIT